METDGTLADISAQHKREVQNHSESSLSFGPAEKTYLAGSETVCAVLQSYWTCWTSVRV
jgi:hypothetical protein